MLKSQLRPLSLAAAFAAVLALAAPARADAVSDGTLLIRSMGDTVVAILANKGLPKAQREERFRQIYRANFDHAIIAASVMGPPWKSASPAARQEYLAVFETYIAKVYAAQLSSYSGEKLEVTKGEADGPGATIESRIVDPKSGRIVDIKWRLRPTDGKMKVRDVLIENISMAQTQRREFAAVLQQRGGKPEGLIAAIREKIADLDKR
ncbi:MAG TPA: ABC transporter substrate-binding protein [Alphaproteobacteria bacterium]|jgi:phospholipid transport system substrate-binding protein